MADVFVRLVKAYREVGLSVRTGLNPLYFGDADAPFTQLFAGGAPVSIGAGLAPVEIDFLECLLRSGPEPQRVLVIGNAFGWSTLALGLIAPGAQIVALDAGLEGEATAEGAELTHAIAARLGLSVRVVNALSPRDLPRVIHDEFGGAPIDVVLIDGLHVNEQLSRDFAGVAPYASASCLFVLHDVLSWHMLQAFDALETGAHREKRVLTRCPSGMGIVFPAELDPDTRDVIDAFCDDTIDLAAWHAALGATPESPGDALTARLSPGWKSRHLGLAATYRAEGREDLARAHIDRLLAESPDAQTHFRVGAWHCDSGRWAEAEPYLRQARALAPAWALPPHQLGRTLCQLHRLAEARALLEEAAAMNPDWAAPCFELGVVMQRLDGDAASVTWFERACALDPRSAPAHVELGAICFRQGLAAQATAHLSRALTCDPDSAHACHLMGLVASRTGDAASGVPWFERAAALAPAWESPHYELGVRLRLLGDLDAALGCFANATAAAPDWAPGWQQAGDCLDAMGRTDDARTYHARAAELNASTAAAERVPAA